MNKSLNRSPVLELNAIISSIAHNCGGAASLRSFQAIMVNMAAIKLREDRVINLCNETLNENLNEPSSLR